MSSPSRLLGKFASFCHSDGASKASDERQLLGTLEDLVAQAKLGEVSAQKLRSSIKSTSALVEQRAQQLVRLNSELEGNERTLDALCELHLVEETVIPLKVAIGTVKSSVQALDLADATRITTLLEPLFRALPEVESVLMGLEKALRSALVDRFQLEEEVAELRRGVLEEIPDVPLSSACSSQLNFGNLTVHKQASSWDGCGDRGGYFNFKPVALVTDGRGSFTSSRGSFDAVGHGGVTIKPCRTSPSDDEPSPMSWDVTGRRSFRPLPKASELAPVMWSSEGDTDLTYEFVLDSNSGEHPQATCVWPAPEKRGRRRRPAFRGMCLFGRGARHETSL